MLNQGAQQPALYSLVITGVLLSIIPLIALFLILQRYWRIDLISGASRDEQHAAPEVARGGPAGDPPRPDDRRRREVAGVSRGTVSRVLNGGHYVSPARAGGRGERDGGDRLRGQLERAALVTRRSGAVAVVLSEPQERLFEDPNFSVLVRTCSLRLAEADQSMVLMIAGNPASASA